MTKEAAITFLTAIACAFFANLYLNNNACKQCAEAAELCQETLHEYKYESGYFGNGKCKIDCKKETLQ